MRCCRKSTCALRRRDELAEWQLASGAQQTNRIYDTSGRLVRYQLGNYARDLTFDPAGRLTSYTHSDLTTGTATAAATALNQSFGYDELGRLTSVTAGSSSWSIGYDANGNRTSVTLNGTQSVYTTSPTSNPLNAVTNLARSFGYDAVGNTASDSTGYTATSYNLANRLETLTKGGLTETFAYDTAGLRIRKFSSSGAASTVLFAYDPQGHLLGEYDQNGAPLREYVWLGPMPVAMFAPDPANGANPPLTYFIHTDHLGAPRVVVDTHNNLRWRWMAEPFGTTAPETNPSSLGAFTMPLRFPGQYADVETGLSDNWHRSYDSTTSRYVQSDPIGLGDGVNTYAYVAGNPVSGFDSLGLYDGSAIAQTTQKLLQSSSEGNPFVAAGLASLAAGAAAYQYCHAHDDDEHNEECRKLLDKINDLIKIIEGRLTDMYEDTYDLKSWAPTKSTAIKVNELNNKGSWNGHVTQLEMQQTRLRRAIQDALRAGCTVPEWAWRMAYVGLPPRK